jgi:hypothetical protein
VIIKNASNKYQLTRESNARVAIQLSLRRQEYLQDACSKPRKLCGYCADEPEAASGNMPRELRWPDGEVRSLNPATDLLRLLFLAIVSSTTTEWPRQLADRSGRDFARRGRWREQGQIQGECP